jgi:hypothetical protein
MPRPHFEAFIDEAGQRSVTARSSDHFVLAAVIIETGPDAAAVTASLAALRTALGRRAGDPLHWLNMKSHGQRLYAAQALAAMPLTVSTVVVCKRHLAASPLPNEHYAYLFTLRFLLERLSWFARDRNATLSYTLAHVVRFRLATLRQYEARLKQAQTAIDWKYLQPPAGAIDQPSRVEQLQLADTAASATFQAFEPDKYGNTETRYLHELASVLYRRPGGRLTSYGLKIHPLTNATRAAYPWVAALG